MSEQLSIPFSATDTRDESYRALIAEGKQLSQSLKLYCLYNEVGNLTDRNAAEILGIPEARVSARRSDLIKEKYPVIDKGKIWDADTKREVHIWGVKK